MPKLVRSNEYVVGRRKSTHYPLPTTHFKVKHGFTLIELLVVIAIIGILAAFAYASFTGTQARGRDARRKSDLDAVKKALELARSECKNGEYYPFEGNITTTTPQLKYNDNAAGLATYLSSSSLNYLKKASYDPKNGDTYYYSYQPRSGTSYSGVGIKVCPGRDGSINGVEGSKDYRLTATLEKANDPDAAASRNNCPKSPTFEFLILPSYTANTYVICPD